GEKASPALRGWPAEGPSGGQKERQGRERRLAPGGEGRRGGEGGRPRAGGARPPRPRPHSCDGEKQPWHPRDRRRRVQERRRRQDVARKAEGERAGQRRLSRANLRVEEQERSEKAEPEVEEEVEAEKTRARRKGIHEEEVRIAPISLPEGRVGIEVRPVEPGGESAGGPLRGRDVAVGGGRPARE